MGDEQSTFEQLIQKDWEDVEAVEAMGDRLLFPGVIRVAKPGGRFEEKPVKLMLLREPELRKAKVLAREWAKEEKLDPKLDPREFENMVAVCELWYAIRNPKPIKGTEPPVHEQFALSPQDLEKSYDTKSLQDVYDRLQQFSRLAEPKAELRDPAQVVAMARVISRRRDISPLVVFDQASQSSFIVSMADMLLSSEGQRSWSEASGSSTAED